MARVYMCIYMYKHVHVVGVRVRTCIYTPEYTQSVCRWPAYTCTYIIHVELYIPVNAAVVHVWHCLVYGDKKIMYQKFTKSSSVPAPSRYTLQFPQCNRNPVDLLMLKTITKPTYLRKYDHVLFSSKPCTCSPCSTHLLLTASHFSTYM